MSMYQLAIEHIIIPFIVERACCHVAYAGRRLRRASRQREHVCPESNRSTVSKAAGHDVACRRAAKQMRACRTLSWICYFHHQCTSPHATMSARPPMTRLKTAEKALTEVECVVRSACVSLRARP
jgi:hypothetical protein